MFQFAGKGDLGYWYRAQDPRSMEQVDTLLANQEYLANQIGAEKAQEIRDDPENFSDADAFRIYHAKARFRATVSTVGAALIASNLAAPQMGFQSGSHLIRANKLAAYPALAATWIVTYSVWHRLVGWTPQKENELTYAKNIRMLRNLQIKQ